MIITFIIPAYNAADTIGRTLDSILYQTDSRYEIIIINDGSTDATETVCKKYSEKRKDKITYIYQENRGLGGARNRGLELAAGEYISFLDSDDWLMPGYVESIVGQLKKISYEDRPEMIMTLPQIYHEGSRQVSDWYDKALFDQIFNQDGVIVSPQEYKEIYQFEVNMCRKVISLDFIKSINFKFREHIKWEDVLPHFWLLSKCTKCMGIGSVGFYYRVGSVSQITAARGSERLDILTVFDDLAKYISREQRKDLEFPAMRVMVRFAIWCIKMADIETRGLLVKEVYRFFQTIPKSYYKSLRRESRHEYSKADAIQYWLFSIAINHKAFCWIFDDYLYQEIGEKTVKKLIGGKERVA